MTQAKAGRSPVRFFCLFIFLLTLAGPFRVFAGEDTSASGPEEVYTGVYLMNLYDMDVNEYSFYADFYLWFKWKGDIDPINIEFVNSVEKWGFTQNMFTEEPRQLSDGWYYNGMRIEGRFYHSFQLSRFPLDRHILEIRMENVDYPVDSLVFVPDTSSSLLREDFIIPGWQIERAAMATQNNRYRTDFGEPGTAGSAYSNFTFQIALARPLSYFLLKLMLPLLVVLAASLGALLIHPAYIDARLSLPIGGLLSCVFLQQSYSSALPDVGYMVLMDRIYLLSYLLIGVILLRAVLAGNAQARAGASNLDQLRRNDRRLFLALFTAYVAGIGLLILFS